MSKLLPTAGRTAPSITGRQGTEFSAARSERRRLRQWTFLYLALIAAVITVSTMIARWVNPAH